jgi:hypothetical protein
MSFTPYENLTAGKQYIVYRPTDDKFKTFWKGTFRGEYQRYFENAPNLIFVDCVQIVDVDTNSDLSYGLMNLDHWKNRADFRKTDIFHDVEKVKENSKYAIQNMESRSLDMILKRLVNEHFEWL